MKTTTQKTMMGLTLEALRQMTGVAARRLSNEAKLDLASSSAGRIVLHLLCAWRDHRFQWHWQGVVREFARV